MVKGSHTVLIVDDDRAICELVCESLVQDGFICDIALTAAEALAKSEICMFDIILLDIKLPDRSGIDLLSLLQSPYQDTKMVVMSAVSDLDTAVQAMKLGASDYILKPFDMDKLSATINTALQRDKKFGSGSSLLQPLGNSCKASKLASQSLSEVNAIACGVEAQVDYFDFHSTTVTERTTEVARRLYLPAKEIEDWAVVRNELYTERNKYIQVALNKLERNPIAQVIMGLTNSIYNSRKVRGNLRNRNDRTHDN